MTVHDETQNVDYEPISCLAAGEARWMAVAEAIFDKDLEFEFVVVIRGGKFNRESWSAASSCKLQKVMHVIKQKLTDAAESSVYKTVKAAR